MKDNLLIGMSQVEITPPGPVSLRATYRLIVSQSVEQSVVVVLPRDMLYAGANVKQILKIVTMRSWK